MFSSNIFKHSTMSLLHVGGLFTNHSNLNEPPAAAPDKKSANFRHISNQNPKSINNEKACLLVFYCIFELDEIVYIYFSIAI